VVGELEKQIEKNKELEDEAHNMETYYSDLEEVRRREK